MTRRSAARRPPLAALPNPGDYPARLREIDDAPPLLALRKRACAFARPMGGARGSATLRRLGTNLPLR
ncbi:MAG: hypothetical protein J2P47_16340, partial [Acetobacteraceae bacterium]|nr:hypothetical protein [Acetobacteraceae bacterium]